MKYFNLYRQAVLVTALAAAMLLVARALRPEPTAQVPSPSADGPIWSMAWSPDGKFIAAATPKGIVLYDAVTLSPIRELNQGESAGSIAFSSNSARLACTCGEGLIRIWDAKSGQLLTTLTDEKGFTSVAFSPSGAEIAGGTRKGSVKVFDAQSEKLLLTLPGPEGDVEALAYTPDGKQILSGSSLTGTVKVWDAGSGQVLHAFPEYSEFFGIVFSPDGKRMASSNIGGDSIKVWDLQSGSLLTTLAPLEAVRFAFSADGKSIICACRQGLLAWDAGNGTPLGQFPNDTSDIFSMALSPDGTKLVVGTREGRVKSIFWGTLAPTPGGAPTAVPSPTVVLYSPWAGTPALGDPPRSDRPLPPGVVNGDIVDCHLLWFIWENTKSRIWFPITAPADWFSTSPFYSDLVDGPDATGRLTARVNSTSGWHIIATTTQDAQEAQQVYIVDEVKRIRYPVRYKTLTASQCLSIPTAAGTQYDPVRAD